ncbi:hypothetical protein HD806DRAFT_339236 [Xylariaceae sp. AK1471]|nr:hypothetical protein HD806DRAFT_339236 [Xylariaceae sp. AK1471]
MKNAKMTSGKHQNQGHSGSEVLPNRSRAPTENFSASRSPSTSSVASDVAAHPESHTQSGQSPAQVTHEQNDLTRSFDSRPSMGSREMSTDLVDEIRKVIRQEFLGTYGQKNRHSRNPMSDDGNVSPTSTDITNKSQEKRLSQSSIVSKSTQGESDDGSPSPTAALGGGSNRMPIPALTPTPFPSSSVSTPLPSLSPTATQAGPPRPGVRFSDIVPLIHSPLSGPASSPAKKAPWTMYRRVSSSSGEPVPEWGVLFDGNGFATARCGQVFRGLARCLAEDFPPRCGLVVTPEKLGLLYSRFRIEGEVYPFEDIFHTLPRQEDNITTTTTGSNRLTTYYDRISDFFADLDCEYYLVPPSTFETSLLIRSPSTLSVSSATAASPLLPVSPRSSSYSSLHSNSNPNPYKPSLPSSRPRSVRPCIPALTPVGFAQFFTTCVLAHPDEEAKRLHKIVNELVLMADMPSNNNLTTPNTPISLSTPTFPTQSPTSLASGGSSSSSAHNRSYSEKLPRQFVRSLFPVRADANSRKLLAAAVEDLLYDLRLSSSSSSFPDSSRSLSISQLSMPPSSSVPSASALQLAEQNRRWSFANIAPTSISLSPEWNKGAVPHLPPPPVPLPRSGSSGAVNIGVGGKNSGKSGSVSGPPAPALLPPSSSAGSLVHFRADPPLPGGGGVGGVDPDSSAHRPHRHHHHGSRHHHHHHSHHRRYGPAEVIVGSHNNKQAPPAPKSRTRKTRFELGEAGDEDDSGSSGTVTTTVATVTARGVDRDRRGGHEHQHGHERERERTRGKDRDRHWEDHRENDRSGDYDYDRERDNPHDRERDRDRRPAPIPTPRRHSDRRRSSAAIITTPTIPLNPNASTISGPGSGPMTSSGNAVGDNNSVAVVVAQQHHDDRGPTWSEVIRAQHQQQQQKTAPKGNTGSSVSFYDERDRTYIP